MCVVAEDDAGGRSRIGGAIAEHELLQVCRRPWWKIDAHGATCRLPFQEVFEQHRLAGAPFASDDSAAVMVDLRGAHAGQRGCMPGAPVNEARIRREAELHLFELVEAQVHGLAPR